MQGVFALSGLRKNFVSRLRFLPLWSISNPSVKVDEVAV